MPTEGTNTGANETGFAEQSTSGEQAESVNNAEFAEPQEQEVESQTEPNEADNGNEGQSVQDDETNHAFAEMRRAREEAEARIAELEAQAQEAADERRENEFEAKKQAQLEQARRIGEEQGLSDEEIREIQDELIEDLEREAEMTEMQSKLEAYENQNAELRAQQMMSADLIAIQKIDPNVKSIADLGETFQRMRMAMDENGDFIISPEEAYYASQAHDKHLDDMKPKPPKAPGFGDASAPEPEYYTKEQVENMSEDDIKNNFDKVMKSMKRWGDA